MPVTLNELERLLDVIRLKMHVSYAPKEYRYFWSNTTGKFTNSFEWCQEKLQMLISNDLRRNDSPGVLKECVDVIENADKSVVEKFKDLKESIRKKFQSKEYDLDRKIDNIQSEIIDCGNDCDSDSDSDCDSIDEDCVEKYEDEANAECAMYLQKCFKLTLEFFSDLHKLYLKAKETAEKPKATTTDALEKKKTQPKSEKKKTQPKSEKTQVKANNAEKEKAKEKAKAEKEKAKAAAEKAKTKAVAEKEKAKAKAAAEKAKAKAAAEKAKAKAKAEKEQEKAKKKAAVDKAKAKENRVNTAIRINKNKDKCADARGKAMEALSKATAMKASKIYTKFQTCEAKIKK